MEALSLSQKHAQITLLAHVLRLRILVAANMCNEVAGALQRVEAALGLSYEPATTPKPRRPGDPSSSSTGQPGARPAEEFIFFDDPLEAAMAVHTLMMSVVYFTHIGSAAEASPRLSHLHALLDSGALDKFSDGTVEVSALLWRHILKLSTRLYMQVKLPAGPPLVIQVTHPRVLFLLAFLVSSIAKRDAVGRKPKRKVFAVEGLASWEKELDVELQSEKHTLAYLDDNSD